MVRGNATRLIETSFFVGQANLIGIKIKPPSKFPVQTCWYLENISGGTLIGVDASDVSQ